MNSEIYKSLGVFLVFIWMCISTLKLILFKVGGDFGDSLGFYIDLLFWGVSFLIILSHLFLIKFNLSKKILYVGIFLFFGVMIFNYKIATFLYMMLLWLSIFIFVSNKDFEILYFSSLVFCFLVIGLYVALNGQTYFFDGRYGEIPTFGFLNPNSFSQFLTIFYIFIARKFILSVFFSLLLYICFKDIIYARTFYFILILQPILFLFINLKFSKLISVYPFFIFTISLLLALYVNSNFVEGLNVLLSGRGNYSSLLLGKIDSVRSILFGVPESIEDNIAVDMSYIAILYDYGLIVALILLYLYARGLKLLVERNEKGLVVIIISFLTYCIVENAFVNYYLNFTLYYVLGVCLGGYKLSKRF